MGRKGYKHTKEAIEKISEAGKRKHSKEHNKKKSEGLKGRKMSSHQYQAYLKSRGIVVLQFSLEGKFIKEYPTIKNAIQETGIGSVSDCCTGRQKRAGNFIFKFKKDNNNSIDDLVLSFKKESFILWKPSFEVLTKEMMKEKGRNYKGRDVGPFLRLCPNCKKEKIEYSTYDAMLSAERSNYRCKKCNHATKGKIGEYSKKCNNEGCENIIFYKRKGDYKHGIENKTICQDCRNDDFSALYINGGLHKNKSEQERKIINQKIVVSRTNHYEKHPEKFEKLLGKIGRCKRFEVHGLLCQGNAEKKYIEILFEKGETLPIKPKGIRTKYGLYFPDFEFEDRYIEIKSIFTYNELMKDGNKQYKKIIELSKTKKVEIIIIEKDKILDKI